MRPIRPSGRTRVLVVEDHEDTRELYAEALRAAGFEVLTANNRKEGVILAHTYRVDVATIDLGIAGGGTPLAADRLTNRVPFVFAPGRVKSLQRM
jgi:DNA-binding response OmpR family regulator